MKKRVKGIITSIIPIVSITCVDEILAHELNQNTSKVNEDGENNYQALPNKVSLDTVIANRSITTPYERTPTNSDILTSLKNSNAAFLYANEVVVSGEILPAGTLIKTKDDSIHYETSAVEITFVVGSKVDFNDTFEYLPNSDYTDNNYWLFDVGTANKITILQTFAANFGNQSLNLNQLTFDFISKNIEQHYGKIRIHPVTNTNYYHPYSSSDATTYIDVNYSGITETQFIFAETWSDPIITGKVITGYQYIPQQDTTLTIPSDVEVIADEAFKDLASTNPNIDTIIFGANARLEIRENAFGVNNNIINVEATLPNVEYLATNAFSGTAWWNQNDVVKTVASTETALGYRYVDTTAFGNSVANFYWVLGPTDDWSEHSDIYTIGITTTQPFGVTSRAFENNKQAQNFTGTVFASAARIVCDYAFANGDFITIGAGGYSYHSTNLYYVGNSAFLNNTRCTLATGTHNGATSLYMSNLYYLGDNAFDGATTFGVSGGNGGQIGNPQWHQVTWMLPNRTTYIGAYALRGTRLRHIYFNPNAPIPYLHSNALQGWNLYVLNSWLPVNNPLPNRTVLNKIDADPNLKNMYLNCISNTTGLSAYELLHQYWLGQNFNTKNGVMGDASGLVLNPTITGQLSLNDQDSTITINSKYQLSPENYGLTMTGTAIDDNIINVTFTYDDTFPTWTVELGENAQVGTYSLRINDFDNDEQWNTRDITIEISA